MTCIAADLGGTFLRCATVSSVDVVGLERIRLAGDARSRSTAVWRDVVDEIAAYALRNAALIPARAPIAFAFPGPVAHGTVTTAPTLLGADAAVPDIKALLAERTRREVVIINDVSAAAWYFAGRVKADRFLVVTISSGIGAKVFDRRHPLGVLDDVPSAGEIGHLVVDDDPAAPACDCGGRGHLGAIASARGFERGARAAAVADPAGFARSRNVTHLGASAATLNNEQHLVPALRAGDPWTTALLRRAIRPLAAVLRVMCVGSGLDGIVLMGGFAQALGERYRGLVAEAVGDLADRGPAARALRDRVFLAHSGEEPSLVGAALYARTGRSEAYARSGRAS